MRLFGLKFLLAAAWVWSTPPILSPSVLLASPAARAAPLPADTAVNCILGEARGEFRTAGYEAFLAVAEALRRRSSTKGVYGCRADLSAEMPALRRTGLFAEAQRAWVSSGYTNITKGADHWGSTLVDGAWIERMESAGMTFTVQIGNHRFYRVKRSRGTE